MRKERGSGRTGSGESGVSGWDASSPLDTVSRGCGEVAAEFEEDSLSHRSLEQRLYRELWEGTPSECDGDDHGGRTCGGTDHRGNGYRGNGYRGAGYRGIGDGGMVVRTCDADELARVLMADAIEDGVEIDEEAVACIATCAQFLWEGGCACKARELMDAVLQLLSSRQANAAWAAGERMGPDDSFTLAWGSLEAVVRELAVLGCGEVLFSSDEWAYLRLLNRYGDPVPLAWMAEQLRCSPEWLSQYVEPSLLDLGLVGITAQGRLALAEIPLHQIDQGVFDARPHETTMSEKAMSGKTISEKAPGESLLSWDPFAEQAEEWEDGHEGGHEAGQSTGEAPALRPCAPEFPGVPRKRWDRSRMLPSTRSGSRIRFGEPVWSTPDSGRTGWIVVEQNWGLARPG